MKFFLDSKKMGEPNNEGEYPTEATTIDILADDGEVLFSIEEVEGDRCEVKVRSGSMRLIHDGKRLSSKIYVRTQDPTCAIIGRWEEDK